jgi:hypothetical protein
MVSETGRIHASFVLCPMQEELPRSELSLEITHPHKQKGLGVKVFLQKQDGRGFQKEKGNCAYMKLKFSIRWEVR